MLPAHSQSAPTPTERRHGTSEEFQGRILLLTELYPPDVGGSAVLLHEGYSRLAGDVMVAADRGHHRSGTTATGTPLVALPIATRRWGVVDPRALAHHAALGFHVRRLATRETVVHCARALPEGMAALAASLAGGPRYVCWTHGEDVTSASTSRELGLAMRQVHRGASALIANSLNTRRLLEESGVAADKIHVVYPGVDAERFSPAVDGRRIREWVAPAGELMLLSVGRLQKRKGHDLAIAAIAALRHRIPPFRYVIVGNGEERARLESLARQHGVSDAVVFAGEVPPEDLPRYYAASDLFLLPNRDENGDIEGFGIVFLEAAASGRPAIGGTTGGVPEAVADGSTGLLVGGTDVAELAGTIERLASDAVLRSRLGREGRARVLRSFTWTATAERIRAVQDIVAGA